MTINNGRKRKTIRYTNFYIKTLRGGKNQSIINLLRILNKTYKDLVTFSWL